MAIYLDSADLADARAAVPLDVLERIGDHPLSEQAIREFEETVRRMDGSASTGTAPPSPRSPGA